MGLGNSTGNTTAQRAASHFATTHWSVVLAAADTASPEAQAALELLCRTYWYPLYTFVRLRGYPPEDAQDLTQSFFEKFVVKHFLRALVPERGRFRSFLLMLLQRFLNDQFDRARAVKRGGDVPLLPFDLAGVEAQIDQAVAARETAEQAFDRAWAETLVQTALAKLRQRYEAQGRAVLFAELRDLLVCPTDRAGYQRRSERLGMSPEAVAMAVVRLRREYRAMVRAEVANTVATPAEVEVEMHYLVNLLIASPGG
jgi:RNA polymerase sigma-70 factor (ECF subfamily)